MLDIDIPQEAIEEVCKSGSNDAAVQEWCKRLCVEDLLTKGQFLSLAKEYGDFSENELHLKTKTELAEFVFWCECWNIFDYQDEKGE